MKTQPLSENEIRAIRYLYCVEGWKRSKIATALNRNVHCIGSLIRRRKFVELKEKLDARIIENAITESEKSSKQIIGLTDQVIIRYLTQVIRAEEKVSAKDAKLTSDIKANIFRIHQVSQGKPDTIKKVENMTEQDFRDLAKETYLLMKQDPLLDLEEFDDEESEPVIN